MKKLHLRFINKINMLLASVIALLGVTGCKQQKAVTEPQNNTDAVVTNQESSPVCMYGVPMANYRFTGMVKNKKGEPISDVRVVINIRGRNYSVYTNNEGKFIFSNSDMPQKQLKITVIDPRNLYMPAEKVQDIEFVDGTSTWDLGNATYNFDFVLEDRELQLLKYGIPDSPMPEGNAVTDKLPEGNDIK